MNSRQIIQAPIKEIVSLHWEFGKKTSVYFLEDDNFDAQAANISVKPEIYMRQMTHETILRLQNNASIVLKRQLGRTLIISLQNEGR